MTEPQNRAERVGPHRLTSPPTVIQLLSTPQVKVGIKHRVMHGVANDAMGLRVQALQEVRTEVLTRGGWMLHYITAKLTIKCSAEFSKEEEKG
jgi:hypothetical protein